MYEIDYRDQALLDIAKLKKNEPIALVITAYGHYEDK